MPNSNADNIIDAGSNNKTGRESKKRILNFLGLFRFLHSEQEFEIPATKEKIILPSVRFTHEAFDEFMQKLNAFIEIKLLLFKFNLPRFKYGANKGQIKNRNNITIEQVKEMDFQKLLSLADNPQALKDGILNILKEVG